MFSVAEPVMVYETDEEVLLFGADGTPVLTTGRAPIGFTS